MNNEPLTQGCPFPLRDRMVNRTIVKADPESALPLPCKVQQPSGKPRRKAESLANVDNRLKCLPAFRYEQQKKLSVCTHTHTHKHSQKL